MKGRLRAVDPQRGGMVPDALAGVPLFAGFTRSEVNALAALIRPRRYPKGSIIFHQGDPGATLYLIEAGEVKLTITSDRVKEVTLALLGPGHFLASSAFWMVGRVQPMR